MSSITELDKQT